MRAPRLSERGVLPWLDDGHPDQVLDDSQRDAPRRPGAVVRPLLLRPAALMRAVVIARIPIAAASRAL
jgi:hypothetical protein